MTDTLQEPADAQIGEYAGGGDLKLKYRLWPGVARADTLVYLHGIESHSVRREDRRGRTDRLCARPQGLRHERA